ncbi:hypothetical protein BPAE_0042g00600 [Botrytis paeoniae]|uniref:Uncharacterized protein n=1 Tax=Botrytis paeoniae TaxID=278948 RepID=A0A4Z1G049_9HELO|nr:hypothetical protein BPAE_0042g00600 [Botrytis paeoniae]
MGSKCDKIAWRIILQENLRTNCISCRPTYKVRSYDDGFLSLTGDVTGHESQGKGGSGPERERQVADFGTEVGVADCHEDDSADE